MDCPGPEEEDLNNLAKFKLKRYDSKDGLMSKVANLYK
jgi:hypothetical protein